MLIIFDLNDCFNTKQSLKEKKESNNKSLKNMLSKRQHNIDNNKL